MDKRKLIEALRSGEAEMKPTPRRRGMGLLADALRGASNYAQREDPSMPMGKANPVLSLLGNMLPIEAAANVMDDLSYGKAPIQGRGMTTRLTPDATELALNALPFPKTAGKTALAALGAVDGAALDRAAIVFHGSPHKFDKFDSSKIGSGEGAQAYGHGLYLAESPDVARTYSADRAYVGAAMQGKPAAINYDDPAWLAQKTIEELGDPAKAMAHLQMVQRTAAKNMSKESAAGVSGAIDLIESGAVSPRGSLYKVDLPDEKIARMLDWDKPLSQQAHALEPFAASHKASLESMPTSGDPYSIPLDLAREMVGSKPAALAYQTLVSQVGPVKASEMLREAGIPGIRFLDAGSRGKGEGQGTSNFVVFPGEEAALTILERNNQRINALRGH